MSIQSFKIDIAEAILDDLRQCLAHARWPDEGEGLAGTMARMQILRNEREF